MRQRIGCARRTNNSHVVGWVEARNPTQPVRQNKLGIVPHLTTPIGQARGLCPYGLKNKGEHEVRPYVLELLVLS
jgi:hypothetical protein